MISERGTTASIAQNSIFTRFNTSPIDLAEYTELKERITLGKKARKNQANKRKATIAELIDEAYVVRLLLDAPSAHEMIAEREMMTMRK